MRYQVFAPGQEIPKNTLIPDQTHSANIVEIKTGKENIENCDGLWARNTNFCLGVTTADCAPIIFKSEKKFGIIHAGWRGCVNGIIENMVEIFISENHEIWIGPIYPRFKIQKNQCYEAIYEKFGNSFFTHDQETKIIYFEFKKCLSSLLPRASFDERCTFSHPRLASWRRDKNFNRGKNITVIGNW